MQTNAQATISFKLQVFGTKTSYDVIATKFDTLEDVLTKNGISAKSGYKFLFLFNGKTLNTLLSVSASGIKSNNKVILFEKALPTSVTELFSTTEEEREIIREERLISEQCRIADLGFSGWECDSKANRVLQEMYESEQAELAEEDEENHNFELFMHGTVVSQPTQICEKPLPRSFLLDDF